MGGALVDIGSEEVSCLCWTSFQHDRHCGIIRIIPSKSILSLQSFSRLSFEDFPCSFTAILTAED